MEPAPQDGWKVLERAPELSRRGESFALATQVVMIKKFFLFS